MPVRHLTATKDGPKEVDLTPVKAIRLHCLECMGWEVTEVRKCTRPTCPLFPFRLGKNPGRKGVGPQS